MICHCNKCGNNNEVHDEDVQDGYESYQCYACMNVAFLPNVGLYRYMCRTIMNEAQAYAALANGDTLVADGWGP